MEKLEVGVTEWDYNSSWEKPTPLEVAFHREQTVKKVHAEEQAGCFSTL